MLNFQACIYKHTSFYPNLCILLLFHQPLPPLLLLLSLSRSNLPLQLPLSLPLPLPPPPLSPANKISAPRPSLQSQNLISPSHPHVAICQSPGSAAGRSKMPSPPPPPPPTLLGSTGCQMAPMQTPLCACKASDASTPRYCHLELAVNLGRLPVPQPKST